MSVAVNALRAQVYSPGRSCASSASPLRGSSLACRGRAALWPPAGDAMARGSMERRRAGPIALRIDAARRVVGGRGIVQASGAGSKGAFVWTAWRIRAAPAAPAGGAVDCGVVGAPGGDRRGGSEWRMRQLWAVAMQRVRAVPTDYFCVRWRSWEEAGVAGMAILSRWMRWTDLSGGGGGIPSTIRPDLWGMRGMG